MTGLDKTMAHLGNAEEYTPVESDAFDEKQFETKIPPYKISGQLFPRNTA